MARNFTRPELSKSDITGFQAAKCVMINPDFEDVARKHAPAQDRGCCIASETLVAVERSGLWVTDIEVLRRHYAETLRAWDRRFQSHRDQVAALFDERFCRMWEFYLIASEYGFRYGDQMVFQIQLTKQPDALPISRDYMAAAEADLTGREPAHKAP